jgi:hypothetical protein
MEWHDESLAHGLRDCFRPGDCRSDTAGAGAGSSAGRSAWGPGSRKGAGNRPGRRSMRSGAAGTSRRARARRKSRTRRRERRRTAARRCACRWPRREGPRWRESMRTRAGRRPDRAGTVRRRASRGATARGRPGATRPRGGRRGRRRAAFRLTLWPMVPRIGNLRRWGLVRCARARTGTVEDLRRAR